jgi:Na+/citrate or Na+/malate symporter
MIGLGMLYVPLESVVSVFSVGYVVVCGSVVIAMALSGYFIASRLNMYPVEAAIVTCCHSGLGGTGTWPFCPRLTGCRSCRSRRSPRVSAVRRR